MLSAQDSRISVMWCLVRDGGSVLQQSLAECTRTAAVLMEQQLGVEVDLRTAWPGFDCTRSVLQVYCMRPAWCCLGFGRSPCFGVGGVVTYQGSSTPPCVRVFVRCCCCGWSRAVAIAVGCCRCLLRPRARRAGG